MTLLSRFIRDSALLFAAIDPIGTVLAFVALTSEDGPPDARASLRAP